MDINEIIQKICIWALPLIFSITLHEVAHGYAASLFGDYTARLSGRLSLNPIRHIDPIGTVALPLLMLMVSNFVFGWAKPVPVDPRNMKHPKRDMAFVAMAGPLANLCMAVGWGLIAKLGFVLGEQGNDWLGAPLFLMGQAGIIMNVVLCVFNLLPLPPLDGGKVMEAILPPRLAYQFSLIEPYGFIILILLMLSGVLSIIIGPFVSLMISVVLSVCGL